MNTVTRTKPLAPAAEKQVYVGLAAFLALGLVAVVVAGGAQLRLPQIDVADQARAALAWVAGLAVVIAGAWLVVLGVLRVSAALAIAGAVFAVVGLTIVGVSVGVPPIFEPIIGILNALVKALNLLLEIVDKMVN